MQKLILQLLYAFGPMIADIIRAKMAQSGAMPTDAEIRAQLDTNLTSGDAEAAAWRAAHGL